MSTLTTEINTQLPDNTTGAITPAIMRGVLMDMVNASTLLTRAQIPTTTIKTDTISLSGFTAAGDLGIGAIYTSVGATSGGVMAIQDAAGTWFNLVTSNEEISVGWFGAKGDGATDDSAAILAAIAAASNEGGGTILFPGTGTYLCLSQITFPLTGSGATATQSPIHLSGDAGLMWDGSWTNSTEKGTTLDLRYNGTVAKILTVGLGYLEISNLTITDNGTSSLPYLYTTFTTLNVHECSFVGNPAKSGATCDQDAIVLGGTTNNYNADPELSHFQGYGTIISHNYSSKIRRFVYGRTDANAVIINNNTGSILNGGDNTAAFIDFDGTGSIGGSRNYDAKIYNNLIEVTGYVYGIKTKNSNNFTFIGNGFYDESASLLACYRHSGDVGTGNHTIFGGTFPTIPLSQLYSDANGAASLAGLINNNAPGTWNFGTGVQFVRISDGDTIFYNNNATTGLFNRNPDISISNLNTTTGSTMSFCHLAPSGAIASGICFRNEDPTNNFGSISIGSRGPAGFSQAVAQFYNKLALFNANIWGISTDTNALFISQSGSNPILNVDTSTASAVTGINIKGAAAAGGVEVNAISSGTDESLKLDAKGAGTITLNGTATGNITTPRGLFSTGIVGLGYNTGAGSTVSQTGSRTTTVSINAPSGQITMFSAAGSTTPATFTVSNTAVAATDTIILNQQSATNLYHFIVTAVASTSFNITFFTTGGTSTDAPVINFNVIKGVAA